MEEESKKQEESKSLALAELGKEYQFKPGQSGNPKGYPKGVKNRSTIARKILEMKGLLPDKVIDKLKTVFPEIESQMTVEEIMTIVQAGKAIEKGDYYAYSALMDSGYGKPQQTLDVKESVDDKANLMSDEEIEKILEKRGYVKK